MKLYQLEDWPPIDERKALGESEITGRIPVNEIRAIKTGEMRCPKKGEWFLSGAIPEAYQATNDLTQEYRIAKLVRIKRVVTERIVAQ